MCCLYSDKQYNIQLQIIAEGGGWKIYSAEVTSF